MSTATRTYRGRAVDELIPQIQRELGTEAIIVRRREGLTGGFLGFFQRPFVEIEAMPGTPRIDLYDEDQGLPPSFLEPERLAAPMPAPSAAPPSLAPPAATIPPPPPRPAPSSFAPAARAYEQPSVQAPPLAPPPPPAAPGPYVTAHLAALARAGSRPPLVERPPRQAPPRVDFHELIPREQPRSYTPPPSESDYRAPASAPAVPASPPRQYERRTVAAGSHSRARAGVEKNLRRLGISEELAAELIDSAGAHVLPLAPRIGLAQAVRATIAQRIPVAPALPTKGAAIVLIGAGGAGKTTCCAALLGAYRSSSTLPASYATIARPEEGDLEMILTPNVMKPTPAASPRALRALRKARAEGIAVIDTPRVSPADRSRIREIASLLAELGPERIVVALPATLSAASAAQLLEALEPIGANALALTHADETDQIGVAIEAACKFDLAPEFMLERARSGGWRISRVDPTSLAAKLLP
jgi:hypothetical protein